MAERPKPSLNPLNDEELANDAAVRIATAAAGPPGGFWSGPKASHGPRPALSLAQLTSGFSHTLRRRVQAFDIDGDGTLDVAELKKTLKDDYKTYKANKQMRVFVAVMLITLLASIGATCGTTYAMVAYLKDTETSEGNVLKSASSHQPLRTGNARGSVTAQITKEQASQVQLRRRGLLESANNTVCEYCPVAITSCAQAEAWFEMLRTETTVSDVIFDIASRKREVINVRAEVWSENPPTIRGRDTNPEHAAKPPRYQVECPERSSWGQLDPCTCDVVYWGTVSVNSTNPSDSGASATTSQYSLPPSSQRRVLASIMHPHHDQFMKAESGHLEMPPLGTLSCSAVDKLHQSRGIGSVAHLTYPCPFSGVNLPVTMKLMNAHVTDAKMGSELVLSTDVTFSPLQYGLGHIKLVCPYGNAHTNWMGEEAAEDPSCSCEIFGAQGRALKQNKKLANDLVSSGLRRDVPLSAELNTSSLEHESTRVNLGRRALLSQSSVQENFSHKFTTAGATGREGPSLTAIQDAYADKAWAQDQTVLKSDSGIQIWTVPRSGTYRIEAQGAQGSSSRKSSQQKGGRGAIMRGDFQLVQGDEVHIVVGQQGIDGCGGQGSFCRWRITSVSGGGGSFVFRNSGQGEAEPMVVAGGGAGAWVDTELEVADASIEEAGKNGVVDSIRHPANALGGTNMTGGQCFDDLFLGGELGGGSGGGAGFSSPSNCMGSGDSLQGSGLPNKFLGGSMESLLNNFGPSSFRWRVDMGLYSIGGFGGGGAAIGSAGSESASEPYTVSRGGGGGYNGGGASGSKICCNMNRIPKELCPYVTLLTWKSHECIGTGAGGGGSFNAGSNQYSEAGRGEGDGYVTFTFLHPSPPPPLPPPPPSPSPPPPSPSPPPPSPSPPPPSPFPPPPSPFPPPPSPFPPPPSPFPPPDSPFPPPSTPSPPSPPFWEDREDSEACFPAAARIWRLDSKPQSVRIDELRLGDTIQTANREGALTWSKVLFMGHQTSEITTAFVEVHLASGHKLRATPDHYLMMSDTPEWQFAQKVTSGDVKLGMFAFSIGKDPSLLACPSSMDGLVPDMVVAVQRVEDKGIFAPVTDSRDALIFVDGAIAHESAAHYADSELLFWKKAVAFLQRVAGKKASEVCHTWLHAHDFPEVYNAWRKQVAPVFNGLRFASLMWSKK